MRTLFRSPLTHRVALQRPPTEQCEEKRQQRWFGVLPQHTTIATASTIYFISNSSPPKMTTENAAVEHMAATEEATPRQEEEGDHHDPGPTTTTAFWTALKNKTSSHNPSTEDDYLERLKSYQTALFCAKPACVSPIVCARFG